MHAFKKFALIVSSTLLLGACSSAVKLDDKVPVVERTGSMSKDGTGAVDPRTVSGVTHRLKRRPQ